MELSAWFASRRAGIVGLGSGRGEASWWDDGGGSVGLDSERKWNGWCE